MKKLTFLLLAASLNLEAQNNLALNHSLEVWDHGMPEFWEIVANTVDVFRSDYRIIPPGISYSDKRYRSKFPTTGSDGNTYFGIAHDEIIKCKLRQPLEDGCLYKLSLRIRKPPIFNTLKVTDLFTFKFETPSNQSRIITIETDQPIDSGAEEWRKVETIFEGFRSKDELFFGYFGDHYDHLEYGAVGLYYLFDDVQLYKSEVLADTVTIRFSSNKYILESHQKLRILESLADKELHSITVRGYASVVGGDEDNLTLAGKRVDAVLKLLENQNIPISTINNGEKESKIGNEEFDRKVVVEIMYHHFNEDAQESSPKLFNPRLAKEISQMEKADQDIRIKLEKCEKDSIRTLLIEEMTVIDSLNQSRLAEIIESTGYPGLSIVGPEYMDAAFLMIHHSKLDIRLKYEELIIEAVNKGEATNSLMPYFIDRNRIDLGKKQIYGTQLYLDEKSGQFKLFELEYPERIDELRKEKGLMPIEDYVKSFSNN